jgi:transposase
MTSILQAEPIGKVVVGVNTHKYVHTAAVVDVVGGLQASISIAADRGGYEQLITWAAGYGHVLGFGVEGTGSYGAGLASHLRRHGHKVVEVNRPDRRVRRQRGKSDPIDAENAARAVLAGTATATPKNAEGTVEMIRHTKIARDTAVKARTQAMVTLKALLVTVPDELREQLTGLSKMALLERCAGLRPGPMSSTVASAKRALRALARRWLDLDQEIKEHDILLEQLTTQQAPELVNTFGIGADTAAEVLIVVGDNPERIHSQAAFVGVLIGVQRCVRVFVQRTSGLGEEGECAAGSDGESVTRW